VAGRCTSIVFHSRRLSSAGRSEGGEPLGGKQTLTIPTYVVWGAGTDVGKTLVSAALCNYMSRSMPEKKVLFLKPYQTGFPADSDADTVPTRMCLYLHPFLDPTRLPFETHTRIAGPRGPSHHALSQDCSSCRSELTQQLIWGRLRLYAGGSRTLAIMLHSF